MRDGVIIRVRLLLICVGLLAAGLLASGISDARQQYASANAPPSQSARQPESMGCWNVVPSPNVGPGPNYLGSVAVLSSDDIWAVGSYQNQGSPLRQTLTMHWNGTEWSIVPSPNVGESTFLYEVAAISPTDVWAVGFYVAESSGPGQTFTMHWDGAQWRVVPSPNPGSRHNYLFGVTASASNDVWAVGRFRNSGQGQVDQTLTIHWDGTEWSVVPSPSPGSWYNVLIAASAASAHDVWAVGRFSNGGPDQALTMHWDGVEWSVVPNPGSASYLWAVSAATGDSAWVVGEYYQGGVGAHTLTMHWDGAQWGIVPSPRLGQSSRLSSVNIIAANDVWSVGSYRDAEEVARSLIMHWDGAQWSIVSGPSPGSLFTSLSGVAALSSSEVWAVGSYGDETTSRTLVERYTDPCPTPTPCTISFTDVQPENPFYPYVRCLACQGIIGGYADGTFRPGNPVTRGQLSKIVANAAGFSEPVSGQTFEDVPPGHAFYEQIGRMAARGIIGGYECGGPGEPCAPANRPYFRPQNNATRGQISKIVANAASIYDPAGEQRFQDVPPGSAFYDHVQRLANRGVIGGYECGGPGEPCSPSNRPYFRPQNDATRGHVSKIVANTFFPGCGPP